MSPEEFEFTAKILRERSGYVLTRDKEGVPYRKSTFRGRP